MPRPSHALVLLLSGLSIAFFALSYCAVTVNWRQRAPLLWMFLPLSGGVGIGLAKGESLDMVLFSLGGAMTLAALGGFYPPRRVRALNRRKAAGEEVDPKEFEPSQRVTWVTVTVITAWICVSYALFGG
jgi:hypothetical protein